MRGVVMYAPGDVRVEDRPTRPSSSRPTRSSGCRRPASAGRTCGRTGASTSSASRDRWATSTPASSRRSAPTSPPSGRASSSSGRSSPPTTPARSAGPATRPPASTARPFGPTGAAQAQRMRVPLADGTLVATPEVPDADLVPDFLAASDVLGTGWFAAVAAEVGPGKTVAVVGDGAVGLLGVMAAQQLGRGADHRHEPARAAAAAGRWSSAPPTSSPNAATTASSRSRSSPAGSARTR